MHMALSKIVILFWWEAQRRQELIMSACTVIGKTPKYRQSCHTDVTIWPEQEQGAQTPIALIQMFIEEFILPVRVYRFLSDTYRCACVTTSGDRRRNRSDVHAHQPSQIYLHLMHLNRLISLSDSGSDLGWRMMGGNHPGQRYDQIQWRPMKPQVQTKPDHVLLHNTGG